MFFGAWHTWCLGFPQIWGTFIGSPYNKESSILGLYWEARKNIEGDSLDQLQLPLGSEVGRMDAHGLSIPDPARGNLDSIEAIAPAGM